MYLKNALHNKIKIFLEKNDNIADIVNNAEYNQKNFKCTTIINNKFDEETYEMLKEIMMRVEFPTVLCPIANEIGRKLFIYAHDVDEILYTIYPDKRTNMFLYIELKSINDLDLLINPGIEEKFKKIDNYRIRLQEEKNIEFETYFIIFGLVILVAVFGDILKHVVHYLHTESNIINDLFSMVESKLRRFKNEYIKVKLTSFYLSKVINKPISISNNDLIDKENLDKKLAIIANSINQDNVFKRYIKKLSNKIHV